MCDLLIDPDFEVPLGLENVVLEGPFGNRDDVACVDDVACG